MSATADEVDTLVDGVPAGSSEAVHRAALETGTRAYKVHRLHIFIIAFGIAAASSGSYFVHPVLAMWCVLRILIPSMDSDLLDTTPFWVISPDRLTKLLRALIDIGKLEVKRYLGHEHFAWAIKRASKLLSTSDLTLRRNEVITLSAPDTGTFLNELRTRHLVGDTSSFAALGQLKAMVGKDGLILHKKRDLDSCLEFARQAPYTVGDSYGDIQNAPQSTQAKIICTFIVDTSEGLASLLWIAEDFGIVELYRRANKHPEARFKPLFHKLSTMAFSTIHQVVNTTSVADVFTIAKTAATSALSTSDFTEAVAKSLEHRWNKVYEHCCTLSEFKGGDSEARAFIANHEATKAVASTSSTGTSATAEMWSALPKQPAYADFLSHLAPLDTTPLDNAAICTYLASAKHPAGLMFLASTVKFPNGSVLSRMLTARAESVVLSALNKHIAIDKKGAYRADWGLVLTSTTVIKLRDGNWLVGTDIDYWRDIGRPYVVAMHGESGAVKIEKEGKRSAAGFFSDPRRMDATRETLERIYSFFGLGNDDVGSPKSVYWTLRNRAEAVDFLEDSVGTRKLQDDVENLALDTIRMMAEGYKLMLNQPLSHATRYTCLVQDMTSLSVRVTKIDEELDRGRLEQKSAAFGGRAVTSMFNTSATQGIDPLPPAPSHYLPNGVVKGWGDSAVINGVWKTPSGFAYGRNFGSKCCIVEPTDPSSAKIDTGDCAANYYLGSSTRTTAPPAFNLDPWCTRPFSCRSHSNAIFDKLSVADNQIIDPSWQCVVRPGAGKGGGGSSNAYPARGAGGGRSQRGGGRGKGANGKGADGKGAPAGKATGRSSRGIGKQTFQRQRN